MVNGRMTKKTEMESKNMKMERNTVETFRTIRKKEMECICSLKEIRTKDNGRMIK